MLVAITTCEHVLRMEVQDICSVLPPSPARLMQAPARLKLLSMLLASTPTETCIASTIAYTLLCTIPYPQRTQHHIQHHTLHHTMHHKQHHTKHQTMYHTMYHSSDYTKHHSLHPTIPSTIPSTKPCAIPCTLPSPIPCIPYHSTPCRASIDSQKGPHSGSSAGWPDWASIVVTTSDIFPTLNARSDF